MYISMEVSVLSEEELQSRLKDLIIERDRYAMKTESLNRLISEYQEILGVTSRSHQQPQANTPRPEPEPNHAPHLPPDNYMRLSEALIAVARKMRGVMPAKQYRDCLTSVGFSRPVSYQNVYNTLTRLVEKKELARSAYNNNFGLPEDVKASTNGSGPSQGYTR